MLRVRRSRRGARRALAAALLAGTLLPGLAFQAGPASAAVDLDQQALEIVSARYDIPIEQLKVLKRATATFPLSDQTATGYKVAGPKRTMFGVTLDPTGKERDPNELATDELRARHDKFGRLDPRLFDAVQRDPGGRLPVVFWLTEPEPQPTRPDAKAKLTPAQVDDSLKRTDALRADEIAKTAAPFLERLSAAGVEGELLPYTPAVRAVVRAAQVQELAELGGVDTVYLGGTRNEAELETSRQTTGADTVNAAGINGNGVQVGVIEVGGRAASTNPFLTVESQDATDACGTASGHTTGVAGIIRARPGISGFPPVASNLRGFASSSRLRVAGSCGGDSDELQDRSTAAADWGARALNLSWGSNIGLTPGPNDRFYDDMVRNRARTVVKSAGNQAGSCGAGDGNTTSPGLAYNLLAVGNFNSNGTAGWGDDSMSGCSSFVDPTSSHGDREKPEMAAPGTNISSTTTAWPWTGNIGSGTSFAAPMVTGTAAQLVQRQPVLGSWPERVKAILMATAVHNVEGASRLSERDGAGALAADRADEVARGVDGISGGRYYSCSSEPNQLNLASWNVVAGQRVRAVIAWDNNTSWWDYANRPVADLDMRVNGPNGFSSLSLSWDNTYEIVDFVAPTSGSYTLRTDKYRCDGNTWLGYAMHVGG